MRVVEVTVPADDGEALREAMDEVESLDHWTVHGGPDRTVMRILVPKERTEAVTDLLSDRFENRDGFRIVLLAVEATLPAPGDGEEEGDGDGDGLGRERPWVEAVPGEPGGALRGPVHGGPARWRL